MELILGLLGLSLFFMIPGGFFLALAARSRARRNEEKLAKLGEEISDLHHRLDVAARRMREVAAGPQAAEAQTAPSAEPPAAPSPAPAASAPEPIPPPAPRPSPAPSPTTASAGPPSPSTPPEVTEKAEPIPVLASTASDPDTAGPVADRPEVPPSSDLPAPGVPTGTPIAAPVRTVVPPGTPASHRPERAAPSFQPRMREPESLEMAIGSSWLNRIGITLVVIGVTFALGYTLAHLGPAGKSALATAAALALLVLGARLETKEGYTDYGRGLIAGGWAGLYVTAYAVHELDATRIVESAALGFALLLLVGAGMIVHSLKYKNEGLTLLTYALSYGAIVIHSIRPYTLAAAALLGAGTVAHLLRRRWYNAAIGGLIATYGSLFLWHVRQPVTDLATLRIGLSALALDWAVFLVAEFASKPSDPFDRLRARWLSVLNALGVSFLAYSAFAQLAPASAWRVPAVLGVVYAVTSTLLRRAERTASHQMHSLAAAAFVALAAADALRPIPATWVVLVESLAILFLGFALRDRFHRVMGSAFLALPLAAVMLEQLAARAKLGEGYYDPARLAIVIGACAAAWMAAWRLRRLPGAGEADRVFATFFSYAAFTLVLLAFFVQLRVVYVAPATALFMLALFVASKALSSAELEVQAYLSAALATASAVGATAPSLMTLGSFHARLPALLVVAAALLTGFVSRKGDDRSYHPQWSSIRSAFAWAGTGLAAATVWLEARPVVVGPAWMVMALLLVEWGLVSREPSLRQPGYVLVVAAHVSMMMSNLTATDLVGGISIRAATILPSLAATYYIWWRLRALDGRGDHREANIQDEVAGRLFSYLGAAAAGMFSRFEFGLNGATIRWSALLAALFFLGYKLRDADFRVQGYLLAFAIAVRAAGFDFVQASPFMGIDGPAAVAIAACLGLIVAGYLIRSARAAPVDDRRAISFESELAANGQDLLWLIAVGLAGTYFYRAVSGFMLIVAWAFEGSVATAWGFAAGSRALRIAGLGILALALVTTLLRAFTEFDTLGRIVSFIVLGIILLLVSLGYTKYVSKTKSAS